VARPSRAMTMRRMPCSSGRLILIAMGTRPAMTARPGASGKILLRASPYPDTHGANPRPGIRKATAKQRQPGDRCSIALKLYNVACVTPRPASAWFDDPSPGSSKSSMHSAALNTSFVLTND
jgi:hypothetical protein